MVVIPISFFVLLAAVFFLMSAAGSFKSLFAESRTPFYRTVLAVRALGHSLAVLACLVYAGWLPVAIF